MDPQETNAPKLVSAMCAMVAASLVFLALRFCCKLRYGKSTGLDDYTLAASWFCLATYAALTIASTKYGIGRHITTLPPGDLETAVKLLYIGEFFAIITIAISKTSFAITLLHLSIETWHRVLVWGVIVSANLTLWSCAFLVMFQCSPIEKLWNPEVEGACLDPHIQIDYSIFAGSWSAAMDFVLAIFPWILIWHLRMRTVEKIGVGVAMSLGILSGVTAAIKTSYLMQSGRWADFSYLSTDLLVWAASEGAVIIIAASIPFLRLAIRQIWQKSSKTRLQGYRLDNSETFGDRASGARSTRRVAVEALPRKQEDQSDSSILGGGIPRGNAIVKTSEYAVEYRDCRRQSHLSEMNGRESDIGYYGR